MCCCLPPPAKMTEEVPIRHLAALVDVATAASTSGGGAGGEVAAAAGAGGAPGHRPRLTLRQFAKTLSQLVRREPRLENDLSAPVLSPSFVERELFSSLPTAADEARPLSSGAIRRR